MPRLNGARLENPDPQITSISSVTSRNPKPVTPSEVARASWSSLPTVLSSDGIQSPLLEPLKPKHGDISAVRTTP